MPEYIKIKKGLDIKLLGEAEKAEAFNYVSSTYAIKPTDFTGILPRLSVNIGDIVKAGTPLFCDKYQEEILFTSPVSGKVIEIKRCDKRELREIIIDADEEIQYIPFEKANPSDLSREEIISRLIKAGIWPLIRQRPYSVIADPKAKPKSIFISAFDSNPLAPDNDYVVHGKGEIFQTGIDAVVKLTDGKVHININAGETPSKVFVNSKGAQVQINKISGPHPAGNIGVQIHHIDPINKGDVVWYLYPQDILTIGRFFMQGRYDATKIVALTGPEVIRPRYYKILSGASIKNMVQDNVKKRDNRYISGNVLTGKKIEQDGYIGFYDTQVTVIPESVNPELLGWLGPGFGKYSVSRTFFSWICPSKKWSLNTNYYGSQRPFVMTGEYEKYFPMDILPVQLLKAVILKDVELMEKLGIYEVAGEDFALCEYVCTSKTECQEIIREGLEIIRKELS